MSREQRSALLVDLTIEPATAERWDDLAVLFGPRGACAGCWCMWWRLSSGEFERSKGEPNRELMRAVVASGEHPGLLAYDSRKPIGWCAIGPREAYPRLLRSRMVRALPGEGVWSVVCFFVTRAYRGQGVALALLRAATAYATARGARIVEGYPVVPKQARMPDAFAWTGLPSTFERAGFVEVARPSASRLVMRWAASPSGPPTY